MELEEDRLSCLPKTILHHILSRLSEKDRARTSVYSKACLDTWCTFPILSFCDDKLLKCLSPFHGLNFGLHRPSLKIEELTPKN